MHRVLVPEVALRVDQRVKAGAGVDIHHRQVKEAAWGGSIDKGRGFGVKGEDAVGTRWQWYCCWCGEHRWRLGSRFSLAWPRFALLLLVLFKACCFCTGNTRGLAKLHLLQLQVQLIHVHLHLCCCCCCHNHWCCCCCYCSLICCAAWALPVLETLHFARKLEGHGAHGQKTKQQGKACNAF